MLVGFIGNYTINFIAKEFKKLTNYDIYISDYCQYQHELIFDSSILKLKNCDYTICFLDGEVLFDSIPLEDMYQHIDLLVNSFNKNKISKYLLISNIYIQNKVNSISNYNKIDDIKKYQSDINDYLRNISISNENIFILDVCSIIEEYGYKNIYDNGMWYFGKNRFNKLGNKLISEKIKYTINAINNNTKKCLVLDLDNTLWGGIIGEDGIGGIKLSRDGIGELFRNFQKEILKIKNKGILLAICSKNNLNDAKEVFDNHKDMILKWDDFIIHKINWELKSENIKNIAIELNIGEDSLVFIDDNPTEREIVGKETNCIVADFPSNEDDLLYFISDVDLKYFSKMSVTEEDKVKLEQYKQNFQRQNEEKSFINIDDFVRNLNISITIYKDNLNHVSRISQLTQKTNQFNLTTKRYSEEDIKAFMFSSNYDVYSVEVTDKFGEYGIVLVSIIAKHENTILIDTFLMSCRVIGKKIENVFLNNMLSNYKDVTIESKYIKTAKNILVEDFYDKNGFECINYNKDEKTYIFKSLEKIDKNLMEVKHGK